MSDLRIVDHTKDRYYSLAISSVWELARIRKARVLVIGAGALGNEVCKNLAMMGVQLMVILDRDTVEAANLSRSVFFRDSDHGRTKTVVLSERLRELNPDVEIVTVNGDLDGALGLGVVRRMDVIFSCLDSRLARRAVNRICAKVQKAWVDGAMENLLGEVAVFVPGQGPCYECNLTQVEKTLIAEAASCRGVALRNLALGKVPTTSTMGSIVAALQVQEGVKLLHGDFKNSLVGKRLVINCNINDFYITSSDPNEDCDGHESFGEIREVPEFCAEQTSAQDLLTRFRNESGEDGFVELGREIVTELLCPACGAAETLGEPIRTINEELQRCPQCGNARQLNTTHVVKGTESYANWPLRRLGIPALDVLEVRGVTTAAWYELTGDLPSLLAERQPESGVGAMGQSP